jgi:hypothetical protein
MRWTCECTPLSPVRMIWPTSPAFYIVTTLAIIMVGLAKGGFAGLGAAAMPMMALVMDPLQAAAMMLPILIAQDAISVWSFRHDFDAATLWLMLPGGLAGVGLGWAFSASVDADAVRGLVGLIAVLFGSYRILQSYGLGMRRTRPLSRWWGTFWGAMSGFTSHVAHAGGPPFQVWDAGGLASDGGLYVPGAWPTFTHAEIAGDARAVLCRSRRQGDGALYRGQPDRRRTA